MFPVSCILLACLKIMKRKKDFSLKMQSTYLSADLVTALSSLQMYDFPHPALFLAVRKTVLTVTSWENSWFFLVLSDSSLLPWVDASYELCVLVRHVTECGACAAECNQTEERSRPSRVEPTNGWPSRGPDEENALVPASWAPLSPRAPLGNNKV